MITDERLDSSVCGLVTESISIDTSTMLNQFEALLSAIQQELQDINAGTACLLKSGGTMYGSLDMGNNSIQNVAEPKNDNDAVPWGTVKNRLSREVESTEYPGCFYRDVGGATEWLNPPMVPGTEYRTTERFNNKPVYTKVINFGALPNATEKKVSSGLSGSNVIKEVTFIIDDSANVASVAYNSNAECCCYLANNNSEFVCVTKSSYFVNFNGTVFLKYTK
jgi:hypothetical protein